MNIFQSLPGIALLSGLLAACSPTAVDSHAGHDHEEHADHGDEVALTDIQIEKIGLSYGKLEKRSMHSRLKVNGTVALLPQQQAQASALLAGRILSIRVKPGDFVQQGSTLAILQNPDLIDLQQDLRETQGQLYFLDKEYARQKDLLADGVIAKDQFQRITSDRAQAAARKQGLTAKLKAYGISPNDSSFADRIAVKSPISGYIDEIQTSLGAYVEPMQSLFVILDNRQPYLELKVFEKDIQWVKTGQKISFHLLNRPDEIMEAEIFALDQMLESQDRSLKVMATPVKSAVKLLPGMYIEAGISMDQQQLPCLPEAAIALDRKLAYIFIKEDTMEGEVHFRQVEVILGQKDNGFVAIETMGVLSDDAEVVVKGAYYLMAQSKKGEATPGHAH